MNLGIGYWAMMPPKTPPCTISEACGARGVTGYCEGDISGDLYLQRDGVAVQELPLTEAVQYANPSTPADNPVPGTYAYGVCTSDGYAGQLCTPTTTISYPGRACPRPPPRCPPGERWCGSFCTPHLCSH